MDRVFLDANILFSAAYHVDSDMRKFWSLAKKGKLELITSIYAVEEARRNMSSIAALADFEKLLLKVEVRPLSRSSRALMNESPGWQKAASSLPKKDMPILEAAISMEATHLVTGDTNHFGPLHGKKIEGVRIISPAQYLRSKI